MWANLTNIEGTSSGREKGAEKDIVWLSGLECVDNNKRGLGIKDVRRQNIGLLVKWWWKLKITLASGRTLWKLNILGRIL